MATFLGEFAPSDQALIRSLWFLITPPVAAALFLLALEFEGGPKMVLQLIPMGMDPVHAADQCCVFKAVVTEQEPHMRPVLLLHMRVVIFTIGPAAGEGDFAFGAPGGSSTRAS